MAAFTNKKVRKDNSRTLSSPDLPPLSLDRFPPEIRDMILTNIAALPKHHLVDMMITSQQMYHHFGKILYHTLRIDEFNAKSVFKGLLLYTRPDEQPLVFRDEFRKDIDFATASKEMISAHIYFKDIPQTLTSIRHVSFGSPLVQAMVWTIPKYQCPNMLHSTFTYSPVQFRT
ncbi:uncharacterized protein L199_007767 [Kwoniella botswanensis]|uniref:uncharacterized protein n=1 Tax=Kwoniella botswanensis TaxID=1268659 RepID=UPI00315C9285